MIKEKLMKEVDELFKKWDTPNSPGCALAIAKDGEVIYKNGYGVANLEYDIPITPQIIFHVASVSKQFTAFSILLLEQEDKLSLNDEIHLYLSYLPQFEKKITIQHLLNHTSGLRDQWALLTMAGWRLDDVITQSDIIDIVKRQQKLNFEPGSKFLYSNTGYTLLSEIVAIVSGMKFTDFTNLKIFKPLEMEHTHFHRCHRHIVKNRAYSYGFGPNGKLVKSILSFANVGATSLFTTVEDMAKWGINFTTGKVGGLDILKKMVQKGVLNDGSELDYANGLVIGSYRGLPIIEHSGEDAGFRSHFLHFPNQQVTIICLSNFATFGPGLYSRKVADIILKEDLEKFPQVYDEKQEEKIKNPNEIVGIYSVNNTLLKISSQNGQFYLDFDFINSIGLPKNPLTPKKGILFQDIDGNEYSFQNFDGKKYQSVYLLGSDLQATRLKQKEISCENLLEFTGKYYSKELLRIYEFTIKEGDLHLIPPRGKQRKMLYFDSDTFRNEGQEVNFFRGEQNDVMGFKISESRVKDLIFKKMV